MLKHYRYNYIPEYSPKNIFYYMTKSNLEENGYFLPNNIEINSEIGKLYFSRRKYLITLIKSTQNDEKMLKNTILYGKIYKYLYITIILLI